MSVDSAGTVFIVDDDAAVRDSLSLLLGMRGYKTRSFARGEHFLAAIDPAACGCVLLDLRMPSVDGIEVQAALAARGIALPIIILTAHGDVASARTTLKGGAFDFLEKPVDDRSQNLAFARRQPRHASPQRVGAFTLDACRGIAAKRRVDRRH